MRISPAPFCAARASVGMSGGHRVQNVLKCALLRPPLPTNIDRELHCMPAITLYVARHGQTALNQQQRFQGSTDAPLNDEGCAQAELLSQRLPAGITRIVASPLLRARQTAEYVAKAH